MSVHRKRSSAPERFGVPPTCNRSILFLAFVALLVPTAVAQGGVPTAADLAETREVVWLDANEPDLLEKAAELGNAASIYEFVRNQFDFALYDGSRSNSTNIF